MRGALSGPRYPELFVLGRKVLAAELADVLALPLARDEVPEPLVVVVDRHLTRQHNGWGTSHHNRIWKIIKHKIKERVINLYIAGHLRLEQLEHPIHEGRNGDRPEGAMLMHT